MKAMIVYILAWGEWQTVMLDCGHRRKVRKADLEREQLYIGKAVVCTECQTERRL